LSAEQALLFALSSVDRVRTTGKEAAPQSDQLTQFNIKLQQYKDSLRNLGMGEQQIEELIRERRYMEKIRITSPADGFVTARNISMGLRFNKGAELFKIADLSRVWVLAEAYENEENYLSPGKSAKIVVPQLGRTLEGKVSTTLPLFDTATRTLKVRLEAANPGFVLKPDMFVDVEIPVAYTPAVTVPVDAVLDSGMRKTIFIDRGDGYFQPREVETGRRFGERVEIVKGLDEGERYVVSGNFLLDSESRMKLGATGVYGTLARDPVCGKDVSVRKADREGRKSVQGGKTFYFSSMACKQQFDGDPARYAGAGEGKQDISTGGSAR
jgi:Cu(I)/Ag(I) efflux system membrane fusion protein